MDKSQINSITETLEALKTSEIWLAELYKTCKKIWPEEEGFWANLEFSEMKHIKFVNRIGELFNSNPDDFKVGRKIKIIVIDTFIDSIKHHIKRLSDGEYTKLQFVSIARDLELAIIERKFYDILTSDNEEYKSLINEINKETIAHKSQLDYRLMQTL